MLSLKDFKAVEVNNIESLKGGGWKFTGGTTNGHRDDMDVNGHYFVSNGDGTYSKPKPIA